MTRRVLRTLHMLRYLWPSPATAFGLTAAAVMVCLGGKARLVSGVVEVGGGRAGALASFFPRAMHFEAITLGHVVLGRTEAVLSCMRAHERVHVRQYERWGVLFFPLYAGSSLWQLLRGRDPYRHNCFEREAFRAAGAGVNRAT